MSSSPSLFKSPFISSQPEAEIPPSYLWITYPLGIKSFGFSSLHCFEMNYLRQFYLVVLFEFRYFLLLLLSVFHFYKIVMQKLLLVI